MSNIPCGLPLEIWAHIWSFMPESMRYRRGGERHVALTVNVLRLVCRVFFEYFEATFDPNPWISRRLKDFSFRGSGVRSRPARSDDLNWAIAYGQGFRKFNRDEAFRVVMDNEAKNAQRKGLRTLRHALTTLPVDKLPSVSLMKEAFHTWDSFSQLKRDLALHPRIDPTSFPTDGETPCAVAVFMDPEPDHVRIRNWIEEVYDVRKRDERIENWRAEEGRWMAIFTSFGRHSFEIYSGKPTDILNGLKRLIKSRVRNRRYTNYDRSLRFELLPKRRRSYWFDAHWN